MNMRYLCTCETVGHEDVKLEAQDPRSAGVETKRAPSPATGFKLKSGKAGFLRTEPQSDDVPASV
jgi:hypothetical protein